MKEKKYFVIYNPVAGKGKYRDKIEAVKTEFQRRGIAYNFYSTNSSSSALQLLKQKFNTERFSDILILGGDGTINQTVNALRGIMFSDFPVSVISMGTGNDTIKHIHKSLDFDYQLRTAFEGIPLPIDAGECNGSIFLNGIGIGFDGKIVEVMASEGEKYARYSSYMKTVIKNIATYKEKEIEVVLDDQSRNFTIFLMTIAKGTTFGGGFLINPHARNNDGLLDICVINKVPLWMRLLYLPRMKNGGHKKLRQVEFYKSENVAVHENNALVAHMDGEFIGSPPFEITVKKSGFRFRS